MQCYSVFGVFQVPGGQAMSDTSLRRHARADAFGMLLSALCMLHCLLLPALVAYGIGGLVVGLDTEWTHLLLLAVVIPVSGVAFIGGWIRHRRVAVLALGIAGVALLALAAFVLHPYYGKTADVSVTTLGGALLIIGHWHNRDRSDLHEGRATDAPLAQEA